MIASITLSEVLTLVTGWASPTSRIEIGPWLFQRLKEGDHTRITLFYTPKDGGQVVLPHVTWLEIRMSRKGLFLVITTERDGGYSEIPVTAD